MGILVLIPFLGLLLVTCNTTTRLMSAWPECIDSIDSTAATTGQHNTHLFLLLLLLLGGHLPQRRLWIAQTLPKPSERRRLQP
jgi:hypothetical protein